MKYRKITATSFGPLHGDELEFGPGLNIVVGPNEARKSSWHGAMYAGLCGRRRAKGRATADDQAFEDRHRPWHRPEWSVRAEISLDDGRNIELRHDLDGRRSEVVDLEFGRPIDDDIMFEGGPDGSRWLGLDRRTYLATACIRQAEILAVADEPTGLRELLQRAASTLGGEMTAASAIEAINGFRRDNVGRDQTNSVRPLRMANKALITAQDHHERCVAAHGEYQLLVAQVDQAVRELQAADDDLEAAAQAERRASAVVELGELDKILSLADKVESAEAVRGLRGDVEALRDAVAQWSVTVEPRALSGLSVDDLEDRIAAVPEALELDADSLLLIDRLTERLRDQRALLAGHDAPTTAPEIDPDLERAVEVAKVASSPPPAVPLDLAAEFERLSVLAAVNDRQLQYSQHAKRLAAAGAIGAIVAGLTGALAIAIVVGVGAMLVAGTAVLLARSIDFHTQERLVEIRQSLAETEAGIVKHVEWTAVAERWLADRDLPKDPSRVAAIVATRAADHSQFIRWVERRGTLEAKVRETEADLLVALGEMGFEGTEVDAAMAAHVERVGEAHRVAEARAALPQLIERLRARKIAEADHADQSARRLAAGRHLIKEVTLHGEEPTDEYTAADLGESLIAHQEQIRERQLEAEKLRAELSARLDGRTLGHVSSRRNELGAALLELDGYSDGVSKPDVEGARARRANLSEVLAEVRGRLNAVDEASVDTASSLAALQSARREVARVERLGETLDLTCTYLKAAQAEAYRTVAPQIASEVNDHLAQLTRGRYTDAKVDPEQLTVRVRDNDGVYRDADRLSHGTAEQIHLLLRLAMARTLTTPGESCPLLIDDATVHADADRTDAVLSLLLELATERQVVLFSQEDQVREWAHANLDGPDHRVIDLEVA